MRQTMVMALLALVLLSLANTFAGNQKFGANAVQVQAQLTDAWADAKGKDQVSVLDTFPTWEHIEGPWNETCDSSFKALAVDPENPDVIYVGSSHLTAGCGVYKTTDGGKNWAAANDGLLQVGLFEKHYPPISKIAIAPSNPEILYLGTALRGTGHIYRSADGGKTWVLRSGQHPWRFWIYDIDTEVWDIAVDPKNPDVVYAGLLGGVYKTSDGGADVEDYSRGIH